MSGTTEAGAVIVTPVVRDSLSAEFFDGARRGEFLLRRDRSTGVVLDPRALVGPEGGTDLEWVPASGRGRVVSWSVVHGRGTPPVVVGIVELAEGPWWWTQIVGADPAGDLTGLSGSAVEVVFAPSGPDEEHEPMPVFQLTPDQP